MATAEALMPPPAQRYQGVQKDSAGYKLLTSMGWKEGEGLGASKQGIKEHIRVKKKFENWGVGAVEAADRARDWSAGMVEFHRVLSTLSEVTSQHASKRSAGDGETSSDEESDASDGELTKSKTKKAAAKKALKASKKADKKAEKKKGKYKGTTEGGEAGKEDKSSKKRKKSKASKVASSDDDSSDSEDDSDAAPAEAAPAPVKRVKLATHLGRFKKRESAKMVQNYSEHDLAAILGTDPFAAAAAAVGEVRTLTRLNSSSESDSDSDMEEAGTDAPSKERKQEQADDAGAKDENESEDGFWWSGYFVRGGRMESLRRKKVKSDKARGFSEQDQTDLYTRVQDGATQGRVGLGRSSMPKKVAGARWEGKRTKLGSDSEGEEEEEGKNENGSGEEEEEEEEKETEGIVVVLPRAAGGSAHPASAAAIAAGGDGGNLGKIKWKKIVAEVLQKNGSFMKLKAVVKAVMEQHGLGKGDKGEVVSQVEICVQGSSKFAVQGKSVSLA